MAKSPVIALTPGEPAGIGPDVCVLLASRPPPVRLVFLADSAVLRPRAKALGLPFEDLGGLVNRKGLAASGQQQLGNLNPLIKGPLEWLTNRQFISGRELSDLSDKGLTGIPLVDQTIMNSPLSRLITTGSTLADERKSPLDKFLNLATGLKVSDVNVDQARRNVVRDFINANLRGPNFRHFDQLSVKPEVVPTLSPRELELFRLNVTQERRGRAEARQRAR